MDAVVGGGSNSAHRYAHSSMDAKRARNSSTSDTVSSKRRNVRLEETTVPGATAGMTQRTRREQVAVNSINDTIKILDMKRVEKQLEKGKVYLRDATLEEWVAFVTSEAQQLKSKNMEWIEGKIFIVELGTRGHEQFVGLLYRTLQDATQTEAQFLVVGLAELQTNKRHLLPDVCCRPSRVLQDPPFNVQLPPGMLWGDFYSVKFEVGWSQAWQQLDWKANQWATFPNVVCVVCIKLEPPNMTGCTYKLHHVVDHRRGLPPVDPIPIDLPGPPNAPNNLVPGPEAVLHLDSRLVLHLPAASDLPENFPPQLAINLFQVLMTARMCADLV